MLILAALLRSNYRKTIAEAESENFYKLSSKLGYPSLEFRREVFKGNNTKTTTIVEYL